MMRTFNMGIGLIVVAAGPDRGAIKLQERRSARSIIGEIVEARRARRSPTFR